MEQINLGIIGAGMIAGVIADAGKQAKLVNLTGIASRREQGARQFAEAQGIQTVFKTWSDMLTADGIDAVYVATPTAAKEEIAIAAANAGKHVLVDKPFASADSLGRIIQACKDNGVAFMDATHFVNHPRTQIIKDSLNDVLGHPMAVRTAFFFPFMDRSNIRFNPEKEPTGAVGDMAWYSMRAVTEYLQPTSLLKSITGTVERDNETGAIVRGSGQLAFEDGKTSTFDFGYNAGVCLMDLDILGTQGMYRLDDFVLDWQRGFAFDNPEHKVGFTHRAGMQTPSEFNYLEASAEQGAAVSMLDNFAGLCASPEGDKAQQSMAISQQTQDLLDAYWQAVR